MILSGNDADNILIGGGGNDILYGGGGQDTLWGGTGSNTFVYKEISTLVSADKIMDFKSVLIRLIYQN